MTQTGATCAPTPEQTPTPVGANQDAGLVNVDLEANIGHDDEERNHDKSSRTIEDLRHNSQFSQKIKEEEEIKNSVEYHKEAVLSDIESPNSTMFGLGFQEAYYDPSTKEVMKDPVVHPNGDSFERSTAMAMDDTLTYYPNRALKSIIEAEIPAIKMEGKSNSSSEESLRFSLRKFDESIRSGLNYLFDTKKPLPDVFYCPITCDLISSPVIDPDGNTYEKAAIYHWIQANGTSPITREPLQIDQLYQNKALFDIIDSEAQRSDESIRPSIRRWKEEKANLDSEVATSAATATAASTSASLPTTHQEIEQIRRQRSQQHSWRLTCLFVLLLFVFWRAPGLVIWVIIPTILIIRCLLYSSRSRVN